MATPVGTIVCPACAAGVPKNATACPYCGAVVVLPKPKGAESPGEFKTYCTRCGQLYPTAAAKCPRCPPGSTDERGGRCPRCRTELSARSVGNVTIDECSGCRGTWFDGDELEHAMDLTTKGIGRQEAISLRPTLPTSAPEQQVRYLSCVRCQEPMARRQAAPRTGMIVDICRVHGVWFDAGELEHFRRFVAAGGLEVGRFDGVASVEAKRKELDRGGPVDFARPHTSDFSGLSDGPSLGIELIRAVGRYFRGFPF